MPTFSIIIPVIAINNYVRETVQYILALDDPEWELTIVTNDPSQSEWKDPRIQMMASGRVGPGAKRDLAAQTAKGQFLVFLDDDSYPKKDLLTVARPFFNDSHVAALGGPAITPPEDGFLQQVSGAVFLSRFSGGSPERYIPLGNVREVQDWPSVNLMVRRADFISIGGFNTVFWPGEDTKLCLQLVKTGKKILYVPQMVVWHHRRPGFFAHLKQVGAYGLHRGFFVKRFPETSRKPAYFAPSVFFLFTLLTIIFLITGGPRGVSLVLGLGWIVYVLALLKAYWDIQLQSGVAVALVAVAYIFGTHLIYGAQFIRGLVFTKNLVSRLR